MHMHVTNTEGEQGGRGNAVFHDLLPPGAHPSLTGGRGDLLLDRVSIPEPDSVLDVLNTEHLRVITSFCVFSWVFFS